MTDLYILDDNGNPVPEPDLATWSRWFSEPRHVAQDGVNGAYVSTVFLGIDHGFGRLPMLFETDRIVSLGGHPTRAWRGTTDQAVDVVVFIAGIATRRGADAEALDAALQANGLETRTI